MITNPEIVAQFERELIRSTKPNYEQNIKIVEALLREAISMGAFPPKDPLDGIEVEIRIARVLNSV